MTLKSLVAEEKLVKPSPRKKIPVFSNRPTLVTSTLPQTLGREGTCCVCFFSGFKKNYFSFLSLTARSTAMKPSITRVIALDSERKMFCRKDVFLKITHFKENKKNKNGLGHKWIVFITFLTYMGTFCLLLCTKEVSYCPLIVKDKKS